MKSSEEIQTVALLSATPALSHQSQLMTWSIAENDPVWGEGRGNFIVFKIQVFIIHSKLFFVFYWFASRANSSWPVCADQVSEISYAFGYFTCIIFLLFYCYWGQAWLSLIQNNFSFADCLQSPGLILHTQLALTKFGRCLRYPLK